MHATAELAKALAHPARIRLLAMLDGGEFCACQLTAVLGLAPSTVSAHLAELRRAGLIEEDKRGRWVYSRSTSEPVRATPPRQVFSLADDDPQLADFRWPKDAPAPRSGRQEPSWCTQRDNTGGLERLEAWP